MSRRRWTDKELTVAVQQSRSRRQVLIQLGLAPRGGTYAVVKQHIIRLKLDTSHFSGPGWNKGGKADWVKKTPLKDILVRGSYYQSYKLKNRLFKEGIKEQRCELCGWKEQSADGRIPVELDHINGNHEDNRLANLRILCPNCHSLQTTHRGKNHYRYKVHIGEGR